MENEGGFCITCKHKHRGKKECPHCDCNWQPIKLEKEPIMIKKIWNKIVSWLFSWQKKKKKKNHSTYRKRQPFKCQ